MSIQNFNIDKNSESVRDLVPKILVIEPDPALGEILCELFESAGYECKIVKDTPNILPILKDYNPDLVLIEYLLPQVNGGELCSQIKNDLRFSNVPVILYSAYPQLLWSVRDYGCDAFLAKPFDLNALLSQVEKLLVRSKEQRRFNLLKIGIKERLNYLHKFLSS
ncbi:response regulator [Pedobacter insulae]|uniref:Response regulator receiver domain-containing protein n=1 Tax=Pedobacter insulae TaxID=414048 RepID=A0A1I2Y770_9SPHI|nr:response regulator [Pedobacter insulae]SFH21513.1 Response regulator receiver domain-containing protein [Pedobacter insulae]